MFTTRPYGAPLCAFSTGVTRRPQPASIVLLNFAFQLVNSLSVRSFGFVGNGPNSEKLLTAVAKMLLKYVRWYSSVHVRENEAFSDQRFEYRLFDENSSVR